MLLVSVMHLETFVRETILICMITVLKVYKGRIRVYLTA